ncbi:hypothetical protein [Salininema proteolyticum]|uniref:Uncharacterized protein n=1 Tax=Salininema proteolyticum TaxID=1607685 RepID=A0ABV8TU11_9ACTN
MPTIEKKLPLDDTTTALVRRAATNILWVIIDSEFAGIVHLDREWIRLCDGWSLPADDLERIRLAALATRDTTPTHRPRPQGGEA